MVRVHIRLTPLQSRLVLAKRNVRLTFTEFFYFGLSRGQPLLLYYLLALNEL